MALVGEGLRKRIPWGQAVRTAEETTPLIEEIELTTIGEEVGTFVAIEEAEAALSVSPLAPVGWILAGLTALGFGAYEIYEHLKSKGHDVDRTEIEKHVEKIQTEHQKQIVERDSRNVDFVPLEHQHKDYDFVPLEDQNLKPGSRGYVLPLHKYTGPGNSLNRGPAYNYADADAKEHDIAYDRAKTSKDITTADKKYLSKAVDHVVDGLSGSGSISDTITGGIGALGIGAKYLAEKYKGNIIYPSLSGEYKWLPLVNESLPIISLGGIIFPQNNKTNTLKIQKQRMYLKIYHPLPQAQARAKDLLTLVQTL
uniref:VP1 n=1 Tax=Aegithalos caudatus ambidensovirus TaxID=2794442 RepID=A0A8E7G296_9VIRU|nr:MAG: VP1 [Aegithalos caudatus ambidensovirus]